MAKPEWGEKHRCSSCSKPFYDMQKDPITCPSCGATHVPEKLLKPRKAAPAKVAKPKAVVPEVETEEDDLLGDDEILEAEDGIDLPDDDDDDDLSGVVAAPVKDDDL